MPSGRQHQALTLGFSILGTLIFVALSLPLPFLFGPMSACLIAALVGAPLKGLSTISKAARTILGVAVGASITPEVLSRLPQMGASVAFVPIYIAVTAAVGEGTPRGGVASVGSARGGVGIGIRAQNFTLVCYGVFRLRSDSPVTAWNFHAEEFPTQTHSVSAKRYGQTAERRFRGELIGVETPRGNRAVRTQR